MGFQYGTLFQERMIFGGWVLLFHRHEETIDHFIVIKQGSYDSYPFLGVAWVFQSLVRHPLEGWRGTFVGKKRREVWRAGLLCLVWTYFEVKN